MARLLAGHCSNLILIMNNTVHNQRISAIDALRGFAVMGIMLLHNIEHFNYYSFPKTELPWLRSLDSSIWDMMFFTFSGKAYEIGRASCRERVCLSV